MEEFSFDFNGAVGSKKDAASLGSELVRPWRQIDYKSP
jgi:hypothetical protein